jgi:hypothetical protein
MTGNRDDMGPDDPRGLWRFVPHSHLANAVATAVLVAVGIWGVLETKNALELSQRAWVSPIGGRLTAPLQKDRAVHFAVFFLNTGREPAVDVASRIQNSTIDAYDPQTTDIRTIKVPDNTSCSNLSTEKGSVLIAPSPQGTATILIFDSIHGDPPLYVDDKIVNGTKFYVLRGCLVYKTYEKVHHSSFCYIAAPIPGTNWDQTPFANCATGFEAD